VFGITTKSSAQCTAFPDVCKTPAPPSPSPVPVPYPNIAMPSNAKGSTCSKKVKICNKKVLTKKSVISSSTGDEAGVNKGIVSNKTRGEAKYKTKSSKVKVEGQGVVYHTCMTAQNGNNANMPAGCQVSPSQVKVTVMQ
jgi:hypothetical protein